MLTFGAQPIYANCMGDNLFDTSLFNGPAKPQRLLLGGGYLTLSDNVYHHYITDYQGNVVLVINTGDRSIEQQTGYYPYGMPHGDAVGADAQPNKYSGKRLQTFAGMDTYDFHARQLPIGIPRFDRPDRLSEDFYHINPYIYCKGDPINYLDQTGDSVYVFNHKGQLIEIFDNDTNDEDGNLIKGEDVICIQDKDGNNIESLDARFPPGTIEKIYSERNWLGIPFLTMIVRGDQNGERVFKTFADNIKIEYCRSAFGLPGRRGLNFITTSHELDHENGFYQLYSGQLKNKYTGRIFDHNHPQNTPVPSDDDLKIKQELIKTYGPNIKMRLYIPKSNIFIEY